MGLNVTFPPPFTHPEQRPHSVKNVNDDLISAVITMNEHRGREKLAITAVETANREFKDRTIKYPTAKGIANMLRVLGWPPELVRIVGSDPINDMIQRFKASPIPRPGYENFAVIFDKRLSGCDPRHPKLGIWAELISKCHLTKLTTVTAYKKLLAKICEGGIKAPLGLSRLAKKQAYTSGLALVGAGMAITLRKTTKCHLDYRANGRPGDFIKTNTYYTTV